MNVVIVTALYTARRLTVYRGKAMTVEVIDVKYPESLAGQLIVPNTCAQMLHLHGRLIKCKVYFQNGQPIKLTKPELAEQDEI